MISACLGDPILLVVQRVFLHILWIVVGGQGHPVKERLVFHLRGDCHQVLPVVWTSWEHWWRNHIQLVHPWISESRRWSRVTLSSLIHSFDCCFAEVFHLHGRVDHHLLRQRRSPRLPRWQRTKLSRIESQSKTGHIQRVQLRVKLLAWLDLWVHKEVGVFQCTCCM